MPDQNAFEARLADAYARYLATVPVAVDARAMAAAAAASAAAHPRWLRGLAGGVGSRRARLPLVVLLATAALVSVAIIGGSLRPVVTPPEASETPPTATGSPRPEPTGFSAPTLSGDYEGGGGLITVSSMSLGVHVLAPDGTGDRTFARGGMYCPRLSPDGTAVAYLLRFAGFYVTNLDDASHLRIATYESVSSFGYKEGVWSPDRAHLAFNDDLGTSHALKVLAVPEGTLSTLVTTPTGELASEAAWSPDSTLVALARGRLGQITIDIVDLQGVVQQSIGPIVEGDGVASLSWSPGGDRLLYADKTTGLYVVDLATGARRALSGPFGSNFWNWPETSPWSRDGEWIAVAGADGDLKIISVDGPLSTSVPMPLGLTAEIKWSPTANSLAFGDQTGLTVVHAGGSFDRVDLMSIGESNPWNYAWSPDGSRIVVAEDRGVSGVEVTNLDATGRSEPFRLATYPDKGTVELCVSWDQLVAP